MEYLLGVAPFQSFWIPGIHILTSSLGDSNAHSSLRNCAIGFGRLREWVFQEKWHWCNGTEEDHSSDNVDEGLQETEDRLRAPAIVLKHHDFRLPLIIDGGQNLIARILLWPIKAFSQLSVILPTSCKVVKILEHAWSKGWLWLEMRYLDARPGLFFEKWQPGN